jgi:hypothetical protein
LELENQEAKRRRDKRRGKQTEPTKQALTREEMTIQDQRHADLSVLAGKDGARGQGPPVLVGL